MISVMVNNEATERGIAGRHGEINAVKTYRRPRKCEPFTIYGCVWEAFFLPEILDTSANLET